MEKSLYKKKMSSHVNFEGWKQNPLNSKKNLSITAQNINHWEPGSINYKCMEKTQPVNHDDKFIFSL